MPLSRFDVTVPHGRSCVATLLLECDGPEDCESDESCCGRYDVDRFAYAHTRCQAACDVDAADIQVCRGGDVCQVQGYVCRDSFALPAPLLVCAPPSARHPEATAGGERPPGCGDRDCDTGEHCCATWLFDHDSQQESWAPLRCVSDAADCSCERADAGVAGSEGGR